jgi:hypothetical protein
VSEADISADASGAIAYRGGFGLNDLLGLISGEFLSCPRHTRRSALCDKANGQVSACIYGGVATDQVAHTNNVKVGGSSVVMPAASKVPPIDIMRHQQDRARRIQNVAADDDPQV